MKHARYEQKQSWSIKANIVAVRLQEKRILRSEKRKLCQKKFSAKIILKSVLRDQYHMLR